MKTISPTKLAIDSNSILEHVPQVLGVASRHDIPTTDSRALRACCVHSTTTRHNHRECCHLVRNSLKPTVLLRLDTSCAPTFTRFAQVQNNPILLHHKSCSPTDSYSAHVNGDNNTVFRVATSRNTDSYTPGAHHGGKTVISCDKTSTGESSR